MKSDYKVTEILADIENFRLNKLKEKKQSFIHLTAARFYRCTVVLPSILMFTVLLSKVGFEFFSSKNLSDTSLAYMQLVVIISMTSAYLGAISQPFVEIALRHKQVLAHIKQPFSIVLENVDTKLHMDQEFINRLAALSVNDLKLYLLELKFETADFRNRLGLILGAIEKVGFVPGLFAFAVTMSKLGEAQPIWVYGIAYASPILHIIGVGMHSLISKAERYARIIELVITCKESGELKASGKLRQKIRCAA